MRRARGRSVQRGRRSACVWLIALVAASGSCQSMPARPSAAAADLLILTTDETTRSALVARLQNVEPMPAERDASASWLLATLERESGGGSYSIRIADAHEAISEGAEGLARAVDRWDPRYILVLGDGVAVVNESPLGAVGIVTLNCDFELDRYTELRDPGNCYRPDGGLRTASLALIAEWTASATANESRSECAPPRVVKMGALSIQDATSPDFATVANGISQGIHRGLLLESEGLHVARAVAALRHERRDSIGFLGIRGLARTLGPGEQLDQTAARATGATTDSCVSRDVAEFAVELIQRRWPVSPRETR